MKAGELLLVRANELALEIDTLQVPSPCVGVCRMRPDRSVCEGCFRTLDELRCWSSADGDERRAIWRLALARAQALATPE